MSTKFSVRPAPRKKPWVCKRSPPCLLPPLQPKTLTASFYIRRVQPPPPGPPMSGTFLLHVIGIGGHEYQGTWSDGPDYYWLTFWYPNHPIMAPRATWQVNTDVDHGDYPNLPLTLPPPMCYKVGAFVGAFEEWSSRLLVTS